MSYADILEIGEDIMKENFVPHLYNKVTMRNKISMCPNLESDDGMSLEGDAPTDAEVEKMGEESTMGCKDFG